MHALLTFTYIFFKVFNQLKLATFGRKTQYVTYFIQLFYW